MTSILTLQDLQSPYRKSLNHKENFLKALPYFSDRELIISIVFRYQSLDNELKNKLIDEVRKRDLDKDRLLSLYKGIKIYKNPLSSSCPCCQAKTHLIKVNNKIVFCLVCGYDIYYDNPKKVGNRIRWMFGIYSTRKMNIKNFMKKLNC